MTIILSIYNLDLIFIFRVRLVFLQSLADAFHGLADIARLGVDELQEVLGNVRVLFQVLANLFQGGVSPEQEQ